MFLNILISTLNVILIALILWFLYQKKDWSLRKFFVPAVLAKLAAGIGVGIVYIYYYSGGDTLNFYEDAKALAEYGYSNTTNFLRFLLDDQQIVGLPHLIYLDQPRALFFVKVLALLKFITFSNYWILSLYLSLFSFLGTWLLANEIADSFEIKGQFIAISFLLIPSVVFWSSGILKESMSIGFASIVFCYFLRYYQTGSIPVSRFVLSIFLMIGLLMLKYYSAALLLSVLLSFLLIRILVAGSPIIAQSPTRQIKFWLLIFVVLMLMASSLHPNLYPQNFLNALILNHDLTLANSSPTSAIHFYHLQAHIGSIALNFPWAVLSCLFRPFVLEANGLLQFAVGIENLILLVLSLAALKNIGQGLRSSHGVIIAGILVYMILGSGILALSSPNFGSLVRYRVSYMPLLGLLILLNNPLLQWVIRKLKSP